MRTKMLLALLAATVLAATFACQAVAATDPAPRADSQTVLLAEIQSLRKDIGDLRAEIAALRAAIANLKRDEARPKSQTPVPGAAGPKILFTLVPGIGGGPDSRGDIAGEVSGLANPENCKVVLYALTNQWYVQPMTVTPFTDITKEGRWHNWTHMGTTYAAVLARPSFKPQAQTPLLPGVGADVLAVAQISASK